VNLSQVEAEKLKKMAIVCAHELKIPSYSPNSGQMPLGIYLKYLIKKSLGRAIRRPYYDYFWTTALLADAVIDYCHFSGDPWLLCAVEEFHKTSRKKVAFKYPKYVDEAMNGNSLTRLRSNSHVELKGVDPTHLADFLKNRHKKTHSGTLPYRQTNGEVVLIDTVGMICPFLAQYGDFFGDELALGLAIKQIVEFIKKGFSSTSGLPYHGYNNISGANLGGEGWGRGIGWFLLGAVGVLAFIPKTNSNYNTLAIKFIELIGRIFDYQAANGSFPTQFSQSIVEADADSGATAMIADACVKGIGLGLIDSSYIRACATAMKFIYSVTDENGRVQECSGEASGANQYSVNKGWYPWGQGPAVSLGSRLLSFNL